MNRRSWLSGVLASLAGMFGFSKAEALHPETLKPIKPDDFAVNPIDGRYEFHTTKLGATEWYKLKVATMELPLDLAPMGISRTLTSYYTFDTIEKLLARIDKIVEERNEYGGYVTFSQTGTDMPFEDETVLTIYHHKILCPRSAGGKWTAWDDYNKKCRCCDKKVIVGHNLCKEHLYLHSVFPKPAWKERWYD